ncbi:MAG: ROK family protein, partial [Candidatus Nanopelagicales bacterium]
MTLAIGIDIGGTKIAGGVVDEDGTILQADRRGTPSRSAEALEAVVVELVNEYKAEYDVTSVGIG